MDLANKNSGFMRFPAVIIYAAMICVGIFLFIRPAYVVLIFSAAVFLHGFQMIAKYLFSKGERNGWDVIGGIINILFGAIMLFGSVGDRVAGLFTMEVFIAIWALCAGVSQILGSIGLKKQKTKGWGWMLVSGILSVICGIIILTAPITGLLMLVGFAGIYAGIMFLIIGFTGLAAALSSNNAAQLQIEDSESRKNG